MSYYSRLQLSEEDAAAIATAIRDEIANLTTHLEEQLSLSLEQVTRLSFLSALSLLFWNRASAVVSRHLTATIMWL